MGTARADGPHSESIVSFLIRMDGQRVPLMDQAAIPNWFVIDGRRNLLESLSAAVIPLRPRKKLGIESKDAHERLNRDRQRMGFSDESFYAMMFITLTRQDAKGEYTIQQPAAVWNLVEPEHFRLGPEELLKKISEAHQEGNFTHKSLEFVYAALTGHWLEAPPHTSDPLPDIPLL